MLGPRSVKVVIHLALATCTSKSKAKVLDFDSFKPYDWKVIIFSIKLWCSEPVKHG